MKYLILVLALTGCRLHDAPEIHQATFNFKQKVRVTEGFYKDLTGTVVDEGVAFPDCGKTYGVDLDDDRQGRIPGEQVICAKRLEAL